MKADDNEHEEKHIRSDKPMDLKLRTRKFALRVIQLYSALPTTKVAQVLGGQLLKAGTSIGAHYREGTRARSVAEFVSKLEGGLQELEESSYWLELMSDAQLFKATRLTPLMKEADELIAILTTCVKNAKGK